LTIRHATTDTDISAVRQLCWAYRDALFSLNPQERTITEIFYPTEYYAALMDRLADEHARPNGMILLAELDGDPVGCGMTHTLEPGICEIKRVFVTQSARGHGVGRTLCRTLMDQARSDGFQTMRLDTSKSLTPARTLYGSMGFTERGPYYDVPEIARDFLCFYEIEL
jgi:GNAT superfamily N-acetyltransferase